MRVLRRYERWRKADNLAMLNSVNGFRRLFGTNMFLVRWLRSWGMNLTDGFVPVKGLIMRQAMGLSGDLPKLARGVALR
jgi:2-octaprenylphenol hydroxylase